MKPAIKAGIATICVILFSAWVVYMALNHTRELAILILLFGTGVFFGWVWYSFYGMFKEEKHVDREPER